MIDHAGQLDSRVTIVTELMISDDFGQLTPSNIVTRDVWAKRVEHIGNEGDNGDQVSSTKRVDFIMRYDAVTLEPNERNYIYFDRETYFIKSIKFADKRKSFQLVRCEYSDAENKYE